MKKITLLLALLVSFMIFPAFALAESYDCYYKDEEKDIEVGYNIGDGKVKIINYITVNAFDEQTVNIGDTNTCYAYLAISAKGGGFYIGLGDTESAATTNNKNEFILKQDLSKSNNKINNKAEYACYYEGKSCDRYNSCQTSIIHYNYGKTPIIEELFGNPVNESQEKLTVKKGNSNHCYKYAITTYPRPDGNVWLQDEKPSSLKDNQILLEFNSSKSRMKLDLTEDKTDSSTSDSYIKSELQIDPNVTFCSSGVKKSFQVIGYIIYIAKIIIPLLLIILGSVDFAKAVISTSDKANSEAISALVRRIIIAVIIFLIPTILDFLLGLIDGAKDAASNSDFTSCMKCLTNPKNCGAPDKFYDEN